MANITMSTKLKNRTNSYVAKEKNVEGKKNLNATKPKIVALKRLLLHKQRNKVVLVLDVIGVIVYVGSGAGEFGVYERAITTERSSLTRPTWGTTCRCLTSAAASRGAATLIYCSFSMFYSQPPYSDLIFSDVTVRLKPIPHKTRSAEIIAGPALIRAARIVSCDAPKSVYYVASDPNFLSSACKVEIGSLMVVAAIAMVVY